jgi:hypothetical protein
MAKTAPIAVTTYAYQVGFGDCLLLKFEYASGDRFVLVDYGTTKLPPTAMKTRMADIAKDIQAKVGPGGLHAVIATHRHQDHISGFSTNAGGTAPGDVIAKLKPRLVLQPWTEDPDVAVDATRPAAKGPNGGGQRFAQALMAMHRFSAEVVRFANSTAGKQRLSAAVRDQLTFIGEDNLKNLSAVKNLMKMGKASKAEYAHFGSKTALSRLLPGVKVHVLGPPTIAQHDNVRNQNPENKEEYWHLAARSLGRSGLPGGRRLFPNAETTRGTRLPAYARWLAYRVRQAQEEELLAVVRAVDDELNNTSLILLFEIGARKLLFPGDAQWENWEYALSKANVRKLLGDTNLYKVGHHGSLNATPKTMWNLLKNKGPASKKGRLETVLSTLPGKHGTERNNSEVPRKPLLTAFREQSHLHSTDELPSDKLYTETRLVI